MQNKKIVLTTPDYPPQKGGLASFSRNLVELLEQMNFEVEVLTWKAGDLIKKGIHIPEAQLYIHVHFMGGLLGHFPKNKSINFCHGSELLFTSPNIVKRIVKKLGRTKALDYLESCKANIFISSFTQKKLLSFGYKTNYSRDFIIHNCIPLNDEPDPKRKDISEVTKIRLCAIARDVPHKNLDGAFTFCELLADASGCEVELSLTSNRFKTNEKVKITPLLNSTDEEVLKVFRESDLNLLLSKDSSKEGFFEGFGLTALEAAAFGVPTVALASGGLPENIHHRYNGFLLHDISKKSVMKFYESAKDEYASWSQNSFSHLKESHGMDTYKRFFDKLLESPLE